MSQIITIPPTVAPFQLDVESSEDKQLERSVEGSLHIRPGVMEVTKDELDYLFKKHPKLKESIKVQASAAEASKPQVEPAPVLMSEEATPVVSPSGKKSKS